MTRQWLHVLLGGVAVALILSPLPRLVEAQEGPLIVVSPQPGPRGSTVTIRGEGFAAADTVFVEMFAVDSSGGGVVRLAAVTADGAGTFRLQAEITFSIPKDYFVMAHPQSFGDRTAQTIGRAPKAVFTLTGPAAPPGTGGAPAVDATNGFVWGILAPGAALASLGVLILLRRKAAAG